jgi:hypothetical protein
MLWTVMARKFSPPRRRWDMLTPFSGGRFRRPPDIGLPSQLKVGWVAARQRPNQAPGQREISISTARTLSTLWRGTVSCSSAQRIWRSWPARSILSSYDNGGAGRVGCSGGVRPLMAGKSACTVVSRHPKPLGSSPPDQRPSSSREAWQPRRSDRAVVMRRSSA